MLLEILFWIIAISAITLLGSFYAKKFNKPDLLIALYVTFIVLSQILAAKIALFDLGFISVFAPAAVLVYSVTYLLTDIVNEKFGKAETHKMILIALICQIAMVFFLWLGTILPSAPFWGNQTAWEAIFSMVPRITIASLIAFFVSENLDAIIFAKFKEITKGKSLWMRNALSSLPSLAIDTILFISLAFYGIQGMDLIALMFGQIVLKWLVGLINIPFMYFNKWVLEKN